MRHRFLAARESELEAERQRAGALEAELVSLRAATPAEIADLVKENTELRKRLLDDPCTGLVFDQNGFVRHAACQICDGDAAALWQPAI